MFSFKKTSLLILTLISLGVLTFKYGGEVSSSIFKIKQKAGIRVLSVPTGAKVFLNDSEVGKTPYEDQNAQSGEYLLKIQQAEGSISGSLVWQSKVSLNPETLTVVNRELSKDATSQAGEVLTLEKGKGATIISTPNGASVEIDGKDYGLTPVSVDIPVGEHTFAVKRGNYLNRSIRAAVPVGFNLSLNVDLALSEADLTNIVTPPITQTPKVVVKDTPTGFLRVREKADISSKEIGRVSPQEELVLLEEVDGWDKVRLASGIEGYVSKTYVEKMP